MKRLTRRDREIIQRLRAESPPAPAPRLERSRARIHAWYGASAPRIQWGRMESPLGTLFVAVTDNGVCAVDFGRTEHDFFARLDPLARWQHDTDTVAHVVGQLREYFAARRRHFDLAVDLSTLTSFQREVLKIARRIAPGQVWTYRGLAEAMGRPECSRPVGQALAHNPVPIIIPCHRVIASDGSLGGYSGGSGLDAKRWLLRHEGAPS